MGQNVNSKVSLANRERLALVRWAPICLMLMNLFQTNTWSETDFKCIPPFRRRPANYPVLLGLCSYFST